MTRDEAVALLKGRLKRVSDTTLDASILAEMKFVQSQLLEGADVLPWFLLSQNLSAVTVVDEERIIVPGTGSRPFLREFEEGALWVQDSENNTWNELQKDDYDALFNRFKDESGIPRAYALDGEYFRLLPTPDAVYNLRVKAYLRDTALDSNIENNWLKYAADLVIAETGAIIATNYLRDAEIAAKFLADIPVARNRLMVFDEARKHANRSYQMGDD